MSTGSLYQTAKAEEHQTPEAYDSHTVSVEGHQRLQFDLPPDTLKPVASLNKHYASPYV